MKQLKKRLLSLFLACVLAAGCTGCSSSERTAVSDDAVYLFYLNDEENSLYPVEYDGSVTPDLLIAKLQEEPGDTDGQCVLPSDVQVQDVQLEDELLTLDFSKSYADMEKTREVLARAAYVRTLLQCPDVAQVQFTIDGTAAKDAAGTEIGVMDSNTFIENAKQINSYQNVAIDLYFADETGTKLKIESRSIYYNTSKPLEWAIVERLIAGPKSDGSRAVIPTSTQIISVTDSDEVCYVNLTKAFITDAYDIDEQIPIYSIVNSICANCKGIKKVQFSIEGDTNMTFRQSMSLKKPYRLKQSLVAEPEAEEAQSS